MEQAAINNTMGNPSVQVHLGNAPKDTLSFANDSFFALVTSEGNGSFDSVGLSSVQAAWLPSTPGGGAFASFHEAGNQIGYGNIHQGNGDYDNLAFNSEDFQVVDWFQGSGRHDVLP